MLIKEIDHAGIVLGGLMVNVTIELHPTRLSIVIRNLFNRKILEDDTIAFTESCNFAVKVNNILTVHELFEAIAPIPMTSQVFLSGHCN
jgi:hypothetical protein